MKIELTKMNNKDLKVLLNNLKKEKNFSIKEVCFDAGISSTTYGSCKILAENLFKILGAYGFNVVADDGEKDNSYIDYSIEVFKTSMEKSAKYIKELQDENEKLKKMLGK